MPLRNYQLEAYANIMRPKVRIALLIWAPGAGKTWFGAYLLCNHPGNHLVVIPTNVLEDVWKRYIAEHKCSEKGSKVEIRTYQYVSLNKYVYMKRQFDFIIVDEAHHLPADFFRWMAKHLKFRKMILLTATPYREDGRVGFIRAIADYVHEVEWKAEKYPPVTVKIVVSYEDKLRTALALYYALKSMKMTPTLIFTERIATCKELAKKLGVPCFYGAIAPTPKEKVRRFKTYCEEYLLKGPQVLVMTRVGEEGLDIPAVRTIIEVEGLGSSRRQILQRLGRLLHTPGGGVYYIVCTPREFDTIYDRVSVLMLKGYKVKIVRV